MQSRHEGAAVRLHDRSIVMKRASGKQPNQAAKKARGKPQPASTAKASETTPQTAPRKDTGDPAGHGPAGNDRTAGHGPAGDDRTA